MCAESVQRLIMLIHQRAYTPSMILNTNAFIGSLTCFETRLSLTESVIKTFQDHLCEFSVHADYFNNANIHDETKTFDIRGKTTIMVKFESAFGKVASQTTRDEKLIFSISFNAFGRSTVSMNNNQQPAAQLVQLATN